MFVCIAVAYSLPYPDHLESHDEERAKLVPSELPESEQKSDPEGPVVPKLIEPVTYSLQVGPDVSFLYLINLTLTNNKYFHL